MIKRPQFIFTISFLLLMVVWYVPALAVEDTISPDCRAPDISKITLIYPDENGTPLTVTWDSSGDNVKSYIVYDHRYTYDKKVEPFRKTINPSFKNNVPPLGKNQSAKYDYYFQAVCHDNTVSAVSEKYTANVTTKPKKRVVKCWGSNRYGEISPIPELTNPSMVSAGANYTCALAKEGVKCWGSNRYGQISPIPELTNPSMISAGSYHACAFAKEGIKCWGLNNFDATHPIPELTNPSMISVGSQQTCVLAKEGIKCWGAEGNKQIGPIPELTMVSTGLSHACALTEEGIKCWGDNAFGAHPIPELTNPSMVSAGWEHTCAISEE